MSNINDLSNITNVTVLNTSILTAFGNFSYFEISVEEARELVSRVTVKSAVGHKATAEVLTELLGVNVPENRIQYSQEVGDAALVFKLNVRIPEGVVLSRSELEALDYTLGVLIRHG